MKTMPAPKQKHNQRIAQYRARPDKERLELVVTPDLAERFRQLPGLERQTHAQKLEALCELWLTQPSPAQTPLPLPIELIPVTNPADQVTGNQRLKPDTGITPQPATTVFVTTMDLDEYDRKIAAMEAELALEDALDLPAGPVQEQELRQLLEKEVRELIRFLDSKWPRRVDTQQSKVAAVWGRVLREEPVVQAAMDLVAGHSANLAEILTSGKSLRSVTPRDIMALASLPAVDQLLMLLYMMQHGCSDRAETQLGELGQRFHQAWLQQPERAPQSWKLKPIPRKPKGANGPPKDEAGYQREMLSAIDVLYEQLYPKDTKPGNTAAARARKQIPAIDALRHTPYQKLYQLLVADLLPVSESELLTLSGLSPNEQRLALWTLVHSRTQNGN